MSDSIPTTKTLDQLTPRQLEIAALLMEGLSNRAIATILSISPQTVKAHLHQIFQKTNLENRVQLAVVFAVWKASNPVTNS